MIYEPVTTDCMDQAEFASHLAEKSQQAKYCRMAFVSLISLGVALIRCINNCQWKD